MDNGFVWRWILLGAGFVWYRPLEPVILNFFKLFELTAHIERSISAVKPPYWMDCCAADTCRAMWKWVCSIFWSLYIAVLLWLLNTNWFHFVALMGSQKGKMKPTNLPLFPRKYTRARNKIENETPKINIKLFVFCR